MLKKIMIGLLASLTVAVPLAGCGGPGQEKLEWPESGVAAILPKPDVEYGSVNVYSDSLSAYLKRASLEDFRDYAAKCKEKGFKIDAEETDDDYEAFNSDGYKVRLSYTDYSNDDNDEISVYLDSPMREGTFIWPAMGLAALLPKPATNDGTINSDSSSFFQINAKATRKEFDAYVNACIKKGFNKDYDKSKDYYSAKDQNGNELEIRYRGFDTMSISVDKSEKEESSKTEKTAAVSSKTESVDFKELLDSYEEFVDEYVAFMKTYRETGNVDGYTEYMNKYAEFMKKVQKIDTSKLSEEDASYYLQVTARVTEKLAAISQ